MASGGNDTLIVRHLPPALSVEEQEELLKHFGATHVRCMGSQGWLKHTAFGLFKNQTTAHHALKRLHQLEVLGSKLVVKFSRNKFAKYHPSVVDELKGNLDDDKEAKDKIEVKISQDIEDKKRLADKVNSTSGKWGVDYPLNPRLQYMYPPPTVSILTNIANALASSPKFYVQVLHLMNKMNLPTPFGPVTPTPLLPEGEQTTTGQQQGQATDVGSKRMSSEESELESDDESPKAKTAPVKRALPESRTQASKPRKKPKLQHILAPNLPTTKAKSTPAAPSQVFEQPNITGSRQIQISFPSDLPHVIAPIPPPMPAPVPPPDNLTLEEILDSASENNPSGFGKIEPVVKEPVAQDDSDGGGDEWGEGDFVSHRQLRKNRISSSEMKDTPGFRNYDQGEATSRVYIKNLHKSTTDKDLHYIYGRYVNWSNEAEKAMFDIRHMKEGRIRGQAFVTLPSEKAAKEAVRETHGFLLHDKPIVVAFARSAKPKEGDDSKTKKKKVPTATLR